MDRLLGALLESLTRILGHVLMSRYWEAGERLKGRIKNRVSRRRVLSGKAWRRRENQCANRQ
jgi:hypothetical protein